MNNSGRGVFFSAAPDEEEKERWVFIVLYNVYPPEAKTLDNVHPPEVQTLQNEHFS